MQFRLQNKTWGKKIHHKFLCQGNIIIQMLQVKSFLKIQLPERFLASMNEQVALQTVLERESLAAEVAAEQLVRLVLAEDVVAQTAALREPGIAHLAAIRPLACMHPQVFFQAVLQRELLLAVVAEVNQTFLPIFLLGFLHFFHHVCHFVS